MLPSHDDHQNAKKTKVSTDFKDIDGQGILQFDWLRTFRAIIEETDFFQTCSFRKIKQNIVIYLIQGEKRLNGLNLCQKILEKILGLFPKIRDFLKDSASPDFGSDFLTSDKISEKFYDPSLRKSVN